MAHIDVSLTRAQRKLVESNVPLARYLARVTWSRNPNEIDFEEITSVAYQGLLTAALRFDPARPDIRKGDLENGKAFAGYARQRIVGTILDWQRSLDHVQRSYRQIYKLLRASGYGNGATTAELALATGLTVEKIRSVTHAVESTPVSWNHETSTPGDGPDGIVRDLPAPNNVESSALETAITRSVQTTIKELTEVQQVIVTLRYYSGSELKSIAETLGLSLTTVREEHTDAILKIHEAMRRKAA